MDIYIYIYIYIYICITWPQWVNYSILGMLLYLLIIDSWINNVQTHIKHRYIWHFLYSLITWPKGSLLNLSRGLQHGTTKLCCEIALRWMPPGNRPLPEPMLTKIYATIWHHKASVMVAIFRCHSGISFLEWKHHIFETNFTGAFSQGSK